MSNCSYDARICQILQQILVVLQQQGVVDLGDIANITESVTPGTGFTDLGKAEDETHVSGETGVLALAVRNDADVALTSTDFDRSPIAVDSAGRVKFAAAITIGSITSITTSVTPGTSAAHLGKAEDAVAGNGDTGVAQLIKRTDTAATQTTTDGDYTVPVANLNGAQLIALDSTFQATVATGLLKLEDAAAASGDAGVVGLVKRTDTASSQTTTDGDYTVPVANSFGSQHVNIDSGFQLAAATGLLKLEDAVAASGDAGVMALAVIQATPAASAADGDYGSLKTDALGKQWNASDQTEDAAHTTGDRGSFILAVRNDSAAAFTTTDLDYSPVAVDSAGRLKLAASTLSLGDVANITTSVTPGTAAANLGKAEDAAAASGDTGVAILLKRTDTAATQTTTDGDYTLPVANLNGAQLIAVDSTFQAAAATGLLKLEDAVAASGDAGVATLAVISSVPAASAADGDYGTLKTGLTGYVYSDTVVRSTGTHTQPTITTATSFTLVAANTARRYLLIKNSSAANIMINLNNGTLTAIAPTSTNLGLVLEPGNFYESPPNWCPVAAITVYQTSGGNINTVSVVEA